MLESVSREAGKAAEFLFFFLLLAFTAWWSFYTKTVDSSWLAPMLVIVIVDTIYFLMVIFFRDHDNRLVWLAYTILVVVVHIFMVATLFIAAYFFSLWEPTILYPTGAYLVLTAFILIFVAAIVHRDKKADKVNKTSDASFLAYSFYIILFVVFMILSFSYTISEDAYWIWPTIIVFFVDVVFLFLAWARSTIMSEDLLQAYLMVMVLVHAVGPIILWILQRFIGWFSASIVTISIAYLLVTLVLSFVIVMVDMSHDEQEQKLGEFPEEE